MPPRLQPPPLSSKTFWLGPILVCLLSQSLDVGITYRHIAQESNPLILLFWRSLSQPLWLPLLWTAFYLGVAYYFYCQGSAFRAVQILFAVSLAHLLGALSWTPLGFVSASTQSFFILAFAIVIGGFSDYLSKLYCTHYASGEKLH